MMQMHMNPAIHSSNAIIIGSESSFMFTYGSFFKNVFHWAANWDETDSSPANQIYQTWTSKNVRDVYEFRPTFATSKSDRSFFLDAVLT